MRLDQKVNLTFWNHKWTVGSSLGPNAEHPPYGRWRQRFCFLQLTPPVCARLVRAVDSKAALAMDATI
jgi:hypothetical protein